MRNRCDAHASTRASKCTESMFPFIVLSSANKQQLISWTNTSERERGGESRQTCFDHFQPLHFSFCSSLSSLSLFRRVYNEPYTISIDLSMAQTMSLSPCRWKGNGKEASEITNRKINCWQWWIYENGVCPRVQQQQQQQHRHSGWHRSLVMRPNVCLFVDTSGAHVRSMDFTLRVENIK